MGRLSGLTDTFTDGSVDTTLWTSNYGTTSETGGRGRIACNDGVFSGFQSASVYRFDWVALQAFPAAANGSPSVCYMGAYVASDTQDGGTDIGWTVDRTTGELRFEMRIAYWDDTYTAVTYDATAHAYIRWRILSSYVIWETSPDGLTWTKRREARAPNWALGATDCCLIVESSRTGGTNNNTEFDNLNQTTAAPPPFPQEPLDIVTELRINDVWTSVTPDVREAGSIVINRGRPNEASRPQPSRMRLRLKSEDGKYNNRNPNSEYFEKLGRNTQIRQRVKGHDGFAYFRHTEDGDVVKLSTTDKAALDITGDIDIRIDMHPDNWVPEQRTAILSKWVHTSDERSWMVTLEASGTVALWWTTGGVTAIGQSSALLNHGSGRGAVRITLDVNNGAAGHTLVYYTADTIDGPWTQVDTETIAGTTSIYSSTAIVEVGTSNSGGAPFVGEAYRFSGRIFAARVYSGIAGTLVANADFRDLEPETASFSDGTNTWTVTAPCYIDNPSYRFAGEVPVWPARWTSDGEYIYTDIEAAGPLRRLGQGSKPLRSPIFRRFSALSPAGYWPLEDGAGSQGAAAAHANGRAARVNDVTFAADDTLLGASAVVQLNSTSSTMNGGFPSHDGGERWAFVFLIKLSATPPSRTPIINFSTTGTARTWHVDITATTYDVGVYDEDGTLLDSTSTLFGTGADPNQWIYHVVEIAESAGDVLWSHSWYPPDFGTIYTTGDQVFVGTPGRLTAWNVSANANNDDASYAHIAGIVDTTDMVMDVDSLGAVNGYRDERAGTRIARLCEEEGVTLAIRGTPGASPPMGRQLTNTLLDLLYECLDVDMGILTELRGSFGLMYVMRNWLHNAPTTCELSYSSAHLASDMVPVEDDLSIRNDITVTRTGGSSYRKIVESGPLSTLDPPDGAGVYDILASANVADDIDLPDQAGWRAHMGTHDEERYPKISVWLQRPQFAVSTSWLMSEVASLDIGSKLTVTDMPTWQPARDVEDLIQSCQEVIKNRGWEFDFNGFPARPYVVGVVDGGTALRIGSSSSTLASGVDDNDTSLSVAISGSQPLWSTTADDFDIEVGGERMTVTAVSGASTPQTFTVTRSVNGVAKSHAIGAQVRLWTRVFIPI